MKRKRLLILCFILLMIFLISFFVKPMVMKVVYPRDYEVYVEKYSKQYNLDKYLVYAVIKAESKFDENAISEAGAVGLMQLMENTANDCNLKGNFNYSLPLKLTNPQINLSLGCFYLKQLIDKFGDIELALMAYNGGPENVEKWLKNDEFSDGKGGLNSTPYKETNRYVEKVLENYKKYKELYGKDE